MTAWDEYVQRATRYIADPQRAAAVRRELRSHLQEAADELEASGLDPLQAAVTAVAEMGPPSAVALGLAEAHHRHLPWRLYLTPVAVSCIAFCLQNWWYDGRAWELAQRWLPFLIFTLWPDRLRWRHPGRLLLVDLRVKTRWLRRQPWTHAVLTGVPAGVAAGLVWGLMPRWIPFGGDYTVVFPLAAALAVAALQRSLLPCPAPLTAAGAALTFPLAYLPGYARWWRPAADWPTMTAFFAIAFGLVALGAGWLAQAAEARGWTLAALLHRTPVRQRRPGAHPVADDTAE